VERQSGSARAEVLSESRGVKCGRLAVWKLAAADKANFLEELVALLSEHRIRYCVIGGQGVNAYAEPLIGPDLQIVVAADQLELMEALMRRYFTVGRFPHSLNVSKPGSNLRVQVQTDPRYLRFPRVCQGTRRPRIETAGCSH
jgi:hypothetical protein